MGDQNLGPALEFTEVVQYVVVWSLPYSRSRPVSTYSVTITGTPGPQTTVVTQTLDDDLEFATSFTITPSVAAGGGTASVFATFDETTTSPVIDTESSSTENSERFPNDTDVFQAESGLSSDTLVPTTSLVGPSVATQTAADLAEGGDESTTTTAQTLTTTTSTSTDVNPEVEVTFTSAVSLQTEPPTSQRQGISPGAAAGIGVGSAVAGAILATLIAFLLLRRRRSGGRGINSGQGSPMQMNDYPFAVGKSAGTSAVPLSQRDSVTYLDEHLASPKDGSDIAKEMAALGSLVAAHVDRFFSVGERVSSVSQPDHGDLAFKLAELLHSEPPIDTGHLAMLLLKPASRPAAVRFILAWSLLKNIESDSPPLTTLLPPELSECMQAMLDKTSPDRTRDHQINRWRHATASLMTQPYPATHITAGDPRQHNLAELYSSLDDILRPFTSQGDDEARENGLRQMLEQGALMGWTLFSQPAHWSFEWGGRCDVVGQGEVVVWPALVRREIETEVDRRMDSRGVERVMVGS